MCIDIFMPGRCIEIPYLLEQIWFRRASGRDRLALTEVYDVLIRNPIGCEPLAEVWALFPHDCTLVEGMSESEDHPLGAQGERGAREIRVAATSMKPTSATELFDWPYLPASRGAENLPGDYVERTYVPDPPPNLDADYVSYSAKNLVAQKGFPPGLDTVLQDVFSHIGKTLIRLDMSLTPLEGGEEGWMRLVVRPVKGAFLWSPRSKTLPGIPIPYEYSQRGTVVCALLVRDAAKIMLRHPPANPREAARCYAEAKAFLEYTLNRPGTSTRCADERVALIADGEDIDIQDVTCSEGAAFYGVIPTLFDKERQVGLMWGCGSNRNTEVDLVHNVNRVIDKLVFMQGQQARRELVQDLAPSGRHEAFSVLIENMLEVGLIAQRRESYGGEEVLTLPFRVGAVDLRDSARRRDLLEPGIVQLRQRYASPGWAGSRSLMRDFRDLHPFRIDFRVTWTASAARGGRKPIVHGSIKGSPEPRVRS